MISNYNMTEIWDIIFEGRKVKIAFTSTKDANNFRVNLQHMKAKKEKFMLDIGFLDEKDIKSLIYKRIDSTILDENGNLSYSYTVYLGDRQKSKISYNIEVF
jgi:c-di-GMP-binding flagellar brake protein YcgR